MNNFLIDELKKIKDVSVEETGDLSLYTGFRTGGKAVIASPYTKESFINTVNYLRDTKSKYYILGNGSNVLAKDEGYDGIVVLTRNALSQIEVKDSQIIAGAGSYLHEVCNKALDSSLSGMEFAYGIPGSVGGAVYMNAGAYDGEIKDVVSSVEYLDGNGNVGFLDNSEILFNYRNSIFHNHKDWIVLSATFELKPGVSSEIKGKMTDLMNRRIDKQPLDYPSCGSTFKRPEGNYASKLIDECGFRGFTVGGAQVSEKHCGFVINKDNASSQDILELMDIIRETVERKTGYVLEPEIEILE